jgi:hypothetical protein
MQRRQIGRAGLGLSMLAMVASAPAASHAAGIAASATAGYQVTFGGDERTVEFTAQRDTANNSRGEGHLFNHVTGAKLHFTIDCLSVAGNVATVSGTLTHTDPDMAAFDGAPMWLRVADNGEGKKSPPDLVSPLVVFPGGPGVPCTSTVFDATIPIEGGNEQVH